MGQRSLVNDFVLAQHRRNIVTVTQPSAVTGGHHRGGSSVVSVGTTVAERRPMANQNQGPVWGPLHFSESIARSPVPGNVELKVVDGGQYRGGYKAVVVLRRGELMTSGQYHPDLADVQGEAVAMARDLCRQEIGRLKQILAWLGTDDAADGNDGT